LSSDGLRIAVSAPYNDDTGDNAGHTRVYEWDGSIWSQMGSDIDGVTPLEQSGYSISLSGHGSRIAIGAIQHSLVKPYAGQVRVYEWSGSDWIQLGQNIDGAESEDEFGSSISLSEDGMRIAVGAPVNSDNGFVTGHVRVYELRDSIWQQMGSELQGQMERASFGASVSMSSVGNRLAVGAPYNSEFRATSGLVQIFEWDGSAWSQMGSNIYGSGVDEQSGTALSLSSSGDYLAIGAPKNDENVLVSGTVRVYSWDGNDWLQKGRDINGFEFERLGSAVSISANGNRLVAGAPNNSDLGTYVGLARIYDWNGTEWSPWTPIIYGEEEWDYSASRLSLNSAGTVLAVSAPRNNANGNSSGHVRVYDLLPSSVDAINSKRIIVFPNPAKHELFLQNIKSDHADIYNQAGQKLMSISSPGQKIDISGLAQGFYMLRARIGDRSFSTQFIKQ